MKVARKLKDLLDRFTEKPVLENLYVAQAVALDQFRRTPEALDAIAAAFNRVTSRDADPLSPGLLLRYMMNRRKEKDWPKLGTAARKFPMVRDLLSERQTEALRQVYLALDETSDEFLFRPRLLHKLEDLFERQVGTRVAGSTLVAVIMGKRKHGEWEKIRATAPGVFSDIAIVAQNHRRRMA
jgi:hypothetical protein